MINIDEILDKHKDVKSAIKEIIIIVLKEAADEAKGYTEFYGKGIIIPKHSTGVNKESITSVINKVKF